MTVTWQVEDGYAGGSRPKHTEVPDDELRDCLTDDDRRKLCEEYIQHDFEQNISWCFSNGYPDFSEVQHVEEPEDNGDTVPFRTEPAPVSKSKPRRRK